MHSVRREAVAREVRREAAAHGVYPERVVVGEVFRDVDHADDQLVGVVLLIGGIAVNVEVALPGGIALQ